MKLDSELKQQWIDALRSGKYQQGEGSLRTKDDEYCCLGVLCDIFDSERWTKRPTESSYTYLYFDEYSFGTLKWQLRQLLGLDEHTQGKLITQNDAGTPFSEIADWIEANL